MTESQKRAAKKGHARNEKAPGLSRSSSGNFNNNLKSWANPIKTCNSVTVTYQSVRFEVFTAVTMKNVDLCDINAQFVLHRRHITYPLQSQAS
jgi:hypothetical protein